MIKSIARHPSHVRNLAASNVLTTPLDGIGPSRTETFLKISAWIILLIVLCVAAVFAVRHIPT